MAGPFYVDISAPGAWNGRNGTDNTTNLWLGITGLQKAFDTAVATEIVYIKGTGDVSKFYTVPYDADNDTTLIDGEAVSWHDGTGVVHITSTTATSPGTVEIELLTGNICSDGDAVTGATSAGQITAHTTIAQKTIDVDINSGTNAAGWIKYIGVNSSWAQDGTRAIFDFNSVAVHGLSLSTNMIWFENIEVRECGTSKSGFFRVAGCSGNVFVNCSSNNNGSMGFTGPMSRAVFFRCTAYLNSNSGFYSDGGGTIFIACSAHDNTAFGWSYMSTYAIGCIAYDNGDDGFGSSALGILINCVADGNSDNGVDYQAGANLYASLLMGCRITNHSGAGDIGLNANSEPCLTLGCYFEDNDGNNIQNAEVHQNISIDGTTASSNEEDQADTNEGYISTTGGSEDFSTNYVSATDPHVRRKAVVIPVV